MFSKFHILMLSVIPVFGYSQSLTAVEIVRKTDANMRGKTLQAEMVIKTTCVGANQVGKSPA